MFRSTVLYTCNNSGMHDVSHAIKFGIVVYDWSNGKALWANAHPMNSDELLLKNAEEVCYQHPRAACPGQNQTSHLWNHKSD